MVEKNGVPVLFRSRCRLVSITLPRSRGSSHSPPFIDANVGTSGEPGVQDEDAPESGRPRETLLQRGVVVQPESLTEPVNHVLPAVASHPRAHFLAHLVVTTSRHLFSAHPSKTRHP